MLCLMPTERYCWQNGVVRVADLTGQRFGRLVVKREVAPHITPSGSKHKKWECECDCGNVREVCEEHLRKGMTKSCGCSRKNLKGTGHPNYKHGLYKTRLYRIWQGMKRRCYCETSDDWLNYGGRGIKMCDEWKDDYSKFQKWAMKNGYDETAQKFCCTIDRIDVNGNYTPTNCRWANASEQANNKRNNIRITYIGKTHTLKEWSDILLFDYDRVNQRMRRGKTFLEAIDGEI